ncbi:dihydrofolate reductase [Patescibacteria group bacterium]|nr:MAG: dihydrofolate reductase [Patescibacteria group bacterium]
MLYGDKNNVTKPKISIVVALGKKIRAIGKGADLLWKISDDLKRFKMLTTGHPIIMGRKTFQSIGRALPNRTNIIVTRDVNFKAENCITAHSIEEALAEAKKVEQSEIFVIGGGEIYTQALPFVDKLYLTLVESDVEGNIFFPEYPEFTKETFREERKDEKTGLVYTWVDLVR